MATVTTAQQRSVKPPHRRMTLDEFRALPEDESLDRMLIKGKLWEEPAMTNRNRWHARTEARLSYYLTKWLFEETKKPFEIYAGEIGCELPGFESRLGIDLAVFSKNVIDQLDSDQKVIVGLPTLVVEILSPTDTIEKINAKFEQYLEAGVPMTWKVDPYDRTVTTYRPKKTPRLFVQGEELTGDDVLPGLSIPVTGIFE